MFWDLLTRSFFLSLIQKNQLFSLKASSLNSLEIVAEEKKKIIPLISYSRNARFSFFRVIVVFVLVRFIFETKKLELNLLLSTTATLSTKMASRRRRRWWRRRQWDKIRRLLPRKTTSSQLELKILKFQDYFPYCPRKDRIMQNNHPAMKVFDLKLLIIFNLNFSGYLTGPRFWNLFNEAYPVRVNLIKTHDKKQSRPMRFFLQRMAAAGIEPSNSQF